LVINKKYTFLYIINQFGSFYYAKIKPAVVIFWKNFKPENNLVMGENLKNQKKWKMVKKK